MGIRFHELMSRVFLVSIPELDFRNFKITDITFSERQICESFYSLVNGGVV